MTLSPTKLLTTEARSGRHPALQAAPREQKVIFGTLFSTAGNHSLGTRLPRTGSGQPAGAISNNNITISSNGNSLA